MNLVVVLKGGKRTDHKKREEKGFGVREANPRQSRRKVK